MNALPQQEAVFSFMVYPPEKKYREGSTNCEKMKKNWVVMMMVMMMGDRQLRGKKVMLTSWADPVPFFPLFFFLARESNLREHKGNESVCLA